MASHAGGSSPNRSVLTEIGGKQLAILDDNTLEVVHRLPLRSMLQGRPVFSPDGRYLFFTTRDAWLTKFDLWSLQTAAEVRVGLQALNPAVSGDGKFVAVANWQPPTLAILDADLNPLKVLAVNSRDGQHASELLAVHTAAPRVSFVVALKNLPELWEISYNPTAPEIPMGVIHDFQYREGAFVPGFLNPIRTVLDHRLDDYAFSADFNEVVTGPSSVGKGEIVNLDARRRIASWEPSTIPRLDAGYSWTWQDRSVIAAPNRSHRSIAVIGTDDGKTVRHIPVSTQPVFVRSHEKSPYLWVGSPSDAHRALQVSLIDKHTLQKGRAWRLAPGRVLSEIGFSRDGRHAFVTSTGKGGSVAVYDTGSLKEIKRLELDRPATARRNAASAVHQ